MPKKTRRNSSKRQVSSVDAESIPVSGPTELVSHGDNNPAILTLDDVKLTVQETDQINACGFTASHKISPKDSCILEGPKTETIVKSSMTEDASNTSTTGIPNGTNLSHSPEKISYTSTTTSSPTSVASGFHQAPSEVASVNSDNLNTSNAVCTNIKEVYTPSDESELNDTLIESSHPSLLSVTTPENVFPEVEGSSSPAVEKSPSPHGMNASNSLETVPENVGDHQQKLNKLQQQMYMMSVRLFNADNQIDQLLKEKRSWFKQNTPCNPPSSAAQSGVGELRGRWLQAKNQAETYKKEKEAMVIKYAQSEQKRLTAEARLQELERRLSKSTNGPPISTPSKSSPAKNVGGDTGGQAATASSTDLQTRLTQSEKALSAARDQLESLRKSQSGAETRISSLETRLSQAQEALKVEQRKTSSQNDTINRLNRSLEAALKQAKDVERLREREAERLCAEVTYQETQERMKRVLAENGELKERLNETNSLRARLTETEKRVAELTSENRELMELHEEIEAGKRREDQMSEFTRRLTEHNANLQSEHLVTLQRLEEATQRLTAQEQLNQQLLTDSATAKEELVARAHHLESQLSKVQSQIEELRRTESELSEKLNKEREQAQLTHRRDAARIRDLVRQLARASQHRVSVPSETSDIGTLTPPSNMGLELTETDSGGSKLGSGSRNPSLHSVDLSTTLTTTTPSLNLINKPIVLGNPLMVSDGRIDQPPSVSDRSPTDPPEDSVEPDQAAVLNKLDRLQRVQVRLTDKIEFFQEHCFELTEELNKKSRIIQHLLVLADKQAGIVSPNSMNLHKDLIARTGGLMASLHTGRGSSNLPDRDTCLEMNQKLQRVLEDTLFKNLTLKENLSTLGLEIASLNTLISDIRTRLCPSCRATTDDLHPTRQTSFNPVPATQPPLRVNPEPPTLEQGGVNA